MTSHDVVANVRRVTGEPSIGHLGTLDPMATGVLPLLLGKYTRLAQFYGQHQKAYTGTIRFGFATDTYDAEGKQVGEAVRPCLTLDEVRAAAEPFRGELDQMPPPVSAKKVGGKPAYKIARAGSTPELKRARVTIAEFAIEDVSGDLATFRVRLSAGGYVRAVAHELGQALGCGAHLASLRRTASGPFTLADALTMDEVEVLVASGELAARLPHPRTLLPEIPGVTADEQTIGRMRNGMQINLPEFGEAPIVKVFAGQRELVGIARRVAGTLFQPMVVLADKAAS